MRVVLQRAISASVSIDGDVVGAFAGPGLVALVGVTHDDTPAIAAKMATKTWELRILDTPDAEELSASDLGAPILVVSQFTLYANTRKGRRPSWNAAAPGSVSEPLVDAYVGSLRSLGAQVSSGRFGAHMQVQLVNDGPVTIILDSADWHSLP
jgi:D-tyrosyl-tRNA(Tyr) deacylase